MWDKLSSLCVYEDVFCESIDTNEIVIIKTSWRKGMINFISGNLLIDHLTKARRVEIFQQLQSLADCSLTTPKAWKRCLNVLRLSEIYVCAVYCLLVPNEKKEKNTQRKSFKTIIELFCNLAIDEEAQIPGSFFSFSNCVLHVHMLECIECLLQHKLNYDSPHQINEMQKTNS